MKHLLSNPNNFDEMIIESKANPTYSIKSYTNGYFYFLSGTKEGEEQAITPSEIPFRVRNELGPLGQSRMV